MVKKYSEITHIFNEHMKGGDGTVEVIPSVVQGEYESDANVIARLILKPGCSLGMHEHIGEEEIITVLHAMSASAKAVADTALQMHRQVKI